MAFRLFGGTILAANVLHINVLPAFAGQTSKAALAPLPIGCTQIDDPAPSVFGPMAVYRLPSQAAGSETGASDSRTEFLLLVFFPVCRS